MKSTWSLVLLLSLTVLLTGCRRGQDDVERLRSFYLQQPTLSARAEILADYGERAYTYTVSLTGGENTGRLTVETPESIAGTGTAWEDGVTSLDYDGIQLETGPITPEGLSPAEGIPSLLGTLRAGAVTGWGRERWGEAGECLRLTLAHPASEQARWEVWGNADTGTLYHAELYWQDSRVLSFTFSDYVVQ